MSLKRFFLICILAFILISPNLFSLENISWTGPDSHKSAIAVNQDGVILVVWCEGLWGEESGTIWYNVNKGYGWEGAKNVNVTVQTVWSPQLDIDSEGNFHLAWADGYTRFSREIYHAVYDPNTGWKDDTMIYNSPENSAWERISIDGDRVYICWFHEHVDPYASDIVMHSKKLDEDWPLSYERLTWHPYDETTHPAFRVKDGKVHMVCMVGVGLYAPWRLQYTEGERGTYWAGVSPTTIYPLGYYPALELDDNDDSHVAFSTRTGNFFCISQENGNWKGAEVISSTHAELQFGDMRYNNNVLIACWVQESASGKSVYYAKKTPGGDWSEAIELYPAYKPDYPQVWVDDAGYAHFVYDDYVSGRERDIYYEKIPAFPPDPFLQVTPDSLSFTVDGEEPDPDTLIVKNVGEEPLTFTISVDQSWMTMTPLSGSLESQEEAEITVQISDLSLDEGIYTGTIKITSPEAKNSPMEVGVTLNFISPPIDAPLNFTGETKENKALFYREYIHYLSWQTNPDNRNIEKYKLYEVSGVNRYFIEEFSSSTFEYQRRHVDKDKTYTYELNAVDNKGRTGDAATLNINGTSVKTDLDVMMDMIGLVWFIQF